MEENSYPLPSFHFEVKWSNDDKESVAFSEVSGLSAELNVIEYRAGNSKEFAPIKMPGLKKFGNVTLKRGALPKDNSLFDWFNKAQLNTTERRNVVISLLDEQHEPVITWKLQNAFPVKIDNGNYNSKSNDVLLESVVLAVESVSVERPKK